MRLGFGQVAKPLPGRDNFGFARRFRAVYSLTANFRKILTCKAAKGCG